MLNPRDALLGVLLLPLIMLGCASSRRSPAFSAFDGELIRQHAETVQGELSKMENGSTAAAPESQAERQSASPTESTAPPAAKSIKLSQLIKRHDEIEQEIVEKSKLGPSFGSEPGAISFPLCRLLGWLYQDGAAGAAVWFVFGGWIIDIPLLPLTLSYDLIRSYKYRHREASWDARITTLRKKLTKIETAPEYAGYLKEEEQIKKRRYELGQILWDTNKGPSERLAEFEISARYALAPSAAWTNFQTVTSSLLLEDFNKAVGDKPNAPEPLIQGKYESRDHFNQRVMAAGREHNEEVRAYNQKVKSYSISSYRRGEIFEHAFRAVFGSPEVSKAAYDPDVRTFTVEVVSNSPSAKYFKQAFKLTDQVPNEDAPLFEKELRMNAPPQIIFQQRGAHINVVSATFKRGETIYPAVPVKGGAKEELARVDLSSLDKVILPAPLEEVKVSYAGGVEKSVHSDVDKPQLPQQPDHPDDFAIVVGIENYQRKGLPPAAFAERDANAVAAYFRAMGVPKENLILLKGVEATNSRIKSYLDSWLPKNVQEDSKVFIYFSGHGSPDPVSRKTYLMPWDGEPKFLQDTAVPVDAVYQSLGKLKSRQIFVAMDSCFSGGGGRSVIQSGARPLFLAASAIVPPNVTVISAAHADEIAQSLENQGHGMLTYFLLKGLNEGKNNAHDLCEFLRLHVIRAAALENQNQHPVCRGRSFKFW